MQKRPSNQCKRRVWLAATLLLLNLLVGAKAQSLEVRSVEGKFFKAPTSSGNVSLWPYTTRSFNLNEPAPELMGGVGALTYSSETFSILTYSFNTEQESLELLPDLFDSYVDDYLPSIDWLNNLNAQWQAELGLFMVNNINTLQTADTLLSTNGQVLSSEFNLGFRWGTSRLDTNSHFDSYSVLLGYGLADKVELNLGYSTLDVDERVYNSAFYEGTWYAGFSAKF